MLYKGDLLIQTVGRAPVAYGSGSLPDVTEADNGKVLGVVNGEWAKTNPSGGDSHVKRIKITPTLNQDDVVTDAESIAVLESVVPYMTSDDTYLEVVVLNEDGTCKGYCTVWVPTMISGQIVIQGEGPYMNIYKNSDGDWVVYAMG